MCVCYQGSEAAAALFRCCFFFFLNVSFWFGFINRVGFGSGLVRIWCKMQRIAWFRNNETDVVLFHQTQRPTHTPFLLLSQGKWKCWLIERIQFWNVEESWGQETRQETLEPTGARRATGGRIFREALGLLRGRKTHTYTHVHTRTHTRTHTLT